MKPGRGAAGGPGAAPTSAPADPAALATRFAAIAHDVGTPLSSAGAAAYLIAELADKLGATAKDDARKMGVSYETMNRWRAKFGGMTVSEAQEKRRLEDENRRLRELVAKFALEITALKDALGKRW